MIPSVEFEDIISKQGRLNKDVRLKINSKQGIYFEPQDVLFGKLRPYLQNWLFPSFYGRAVGDFWVLRANSSLLSEYLFVLIQSPRFQSVANISAGTKMPRSDWNTVSNTSFSIPVQSEQRRIGQLFNVLDDLIAATQRRIDALEQAKKALLQRLFDQSWRFKGYSDPWEKRKLGDIFYQVSFFVNPEDAKLELWSLTVAEGLTPKSIRYDRNFLVRKQDKFKVVHSEDFVYNPMNITLGALDQNKLLKSVAVSGYYTTMSINRGFDGSFFKFLLSSPLMIRKYKNYATGSLLEKQRVQFSTFSIINIKAPKFDEQNKIGNFLIKLDHLIAATQSRLSSLELLKKALLQDLFI